MRLQSEGRRALARSRKLAITTVFTALVCVTTMVFSIYVPQTRGYFNIGEGMVYITALLFGPVIGSFAGGVGSMLADLLLGYTQFAPATLVIKAIEGGIVGLISRKAIKFQSKTELNSRQDMLTWHYLWKTKKRAIRWD